MKKNQPLVSIIMPAFNVSAYIGQAIASILAQTHNNLELIIIDDASTDNTLTIAQAHQARDKRVKIISMPKNMGVGPTRQIGINQAAGDYILWQDADDYSSPDRLHHLLAALRRVKNLSAVGSGFYQVRGKKIKIGKPQTRLADKSSAHIAIHFPTLLVKKMVYRQVPYRPFFQGEDADWCYRLLENNGVIKTIAAPLYYYRKHATSLTKNDFQKFTSGMMVRLARVARQKNLPDPFDKLRTIAAKDFVLLYDRKIYPSLQKKIGDEINWFLLENTRQILTRPWFGYKYIYAMGRFFVLAGPRHFYKTAMVFFLRWAINILPYIITRKIIF